MLNFHLNKTQPLPSGWSMYLYMGGSQEAWEGVNPKLEWAPNGLNLIQGYQPLAGRSEGLSVNSG